VIESRELERIGKTSEFADLMSESRIDDLSLTRRPPINPRPASEAVIRWINDR
jgi:hypothetical protein